MRRRRSRIKVCLAVCLAAGMLGCGSTDGGHTEDQASEMTPAEGASDAEAASGPREGGAKDAEAASGLREGGAKDVEAASGPKESGAKDAEAASGPKESGAKDAETVDNPKEGEAGQEVQTEGLSAGSGTAEAEGENLSFSLAGENAILALPQEVQQQIADINMGEAPADATGLEELKDYYALVATYTVVGKSEESGEEITGRGRLTLYIPNLLDSLQDVSVLFYDNAEGQWNILPVERMDTDARTVSVILPGSGTLTVIYRRQ